jgi:hypothetical protein
MNVLNSTVSPPSARKKKSGPDVTLVSKPYYVPGDLIKLGLSKCLVYGGVKSGDIPSRRIGKKIIIDPGWVRETFDLNVA